MDFLVLDADYRRNAVRLGISLRPPVHRLVAFMGNNRPQDNSQARVWFELLASRINGRDYWVF